MASGLSGNTTYLVGLNPSILLSATFSAISGGVIMPKPSPKLAPARKPAIGRKLATRPQPTKPSYKTIVTDAEKAIGSPPWVHLLTFMQRGWREDQILRGRNTDSHILSQLRADGLWPKRAGKKRAAGKARRSAK
jgi:hypothetical protein